MTTAEYQKRRDATICQNGHVGRYVEYADKRRCIDCRREQTRRAGRKHEQTNPNRKLAYRVKEKAYRQRKPLETSARRKVQKAVFEGRIVHPDTCERCEAPTKVQGHHYDYTRPYNLLWLCADCHVWLHFAKVEDTR